MKWNRTAALNLAFVVTALAILFFLLRAPQESTARVPKDDIHRQFHEIANKKEAEKFCTECHRPDGSSPLSPEHPATYRCLFCHKR